MSSLVGVVLAGGRSRRMGKDKSSIEVAGQTMLQMAHDKLKSICSEVVVSGMAKLEGVKSIGDEDFGSGPATGIYSTLRYANTPVFVLACDMPFVSKSLLQYLLVEHKEDVAATIPIHDGKIQPLCGIYHPRCLSTLTASLAAGELRITDIAQKIGARFVQINSDVPDYSPHLFLNMNTPADVEIVLQLLQDSK